MLLASFIREGLSALDALYPAREARSLLLLLCGEVLGTSSYTHIVEPSYAIAPEKEGLLREALSRLAEGEPLQYILGKAHFAGRSFRVTPDVLIPRPETELLVQEAVKLRPARVLDLCTGSGIIAWSVALGVPGARVVAVDISEKALEVARTQPLPPNARPPAPCRPSLFRPMSWIRSRTFPSAPSTSSLPIRPM